MSPSSGPFIECSKCGQRIRSKSQHDLATCKCKATFVDGGAAYLRVGGYPVMDGARIKTWEVTRESE